MAMHARELPADRIREVEARSAGFRRELGLANLVLIQIMYVVGSGWVGTAAKTLGPSHIWFWLAAAALFYVPQAAVVIFLNRLMPLEGGLYQWATVGLGEFAGFLVAWNLWAYAILILATFGVMIATNLAYLLGSGAGFTGAPGYSAIVSVAAISVITVVSLFGLRVGKWFQNAGGAAQLLTYCALILIPTVAVLRGSTLRAEALTVTAPHFDLLSLNTFGKLAVGAFSGFEYVAILAGECRSPARTIGRSVSIALPIIALMFILGTGSVLALVPRQDIDLVSPIPQTITIGFSGLGAAEVIAKVLILLLLVRQVGNSILLFAGSTRLPMVAGWDGLLPAWFTRLHPRFRTPTNSILFVGAVSVALALAGLSGVGVQEAFQLLENAGGIFYAFAYLALFAIPLVAAHRLSERPPRWLQLAAVAGFAVTLMYAVLSIFPIIEVESWVIFAAKIIAVLVAANLVGVAIYAWGRRRAISMT
jgi:glutamate:GABA antiporter